MNLVKLVQTMISNTTHFVDELDQIIDYLLFAMGKSSWLLWFLVDFAVAQCNSVIFSQFFFDVLHHKIMPLLSFCNYKHSSHSLSITLYIHA